MSSKPQSIGGWGYIGSYLASQIPPAGLNALQVLFLDNGTGVPPYGSYQYSDGQTWQAFGGASTFAALGGVPGDNAALAAVLAGKTDSLAPTVLTASTAITHAAHLNRPLSIAQAGATTMTFAGNARPARWREMRSNCSTPALVR